MAFESNGIKKQNTVAIIMGGWRGRFTVQVMCQEAEAGGRSSIIASLPENEVKTHKQKNCNNIKSVCIYVCVHVYI